MTVVVPFGKVEPGLWEAVKVAAQLSDTNGGVQLTVALQDAPAVAVILGGQPVKTGLSASVTVTLKVQVDVFPLSLAVYVTAVVPIGKRAPGLCVLVKVSDEQAEGALQDTAFKQEVSSVVVMLDGQLVMMGEAQQSAPPFLLIPLTTVKSPITELA